MKKIPFLLLLVLALVSGCKKEVEEVEKIFTFDISNSKSIKISKDTVNAVHQYQAFVNMPPLPVSGVSSSAEADFQRNGTTTNLVKNIKAQELILTMPDNSPATFKFLERMDVEIAMEDGSDPVLMAYNRNIPATIGRRLVFTPTENTMDKYVKAGKYNLNLVNVRLRDTVSSDLNITANMTFKVTASPIK